MGDEPRRPAWRPIAEAYRRWVRWDMIERDLTPEELAAAIRDAEELIGVFGPNTESATKRPNGGQDEDPVERLPRWNGQA